jgi:hypothetical protein
VPDACKKTVPLATFPYLIAYNLFSYRSRAEVDILNRWKSASMSAEPRNSAKCFAPAVFGIDDAERDAVRNRSLGLGISRATAGRWRSRFLEGRLQGLNDEQRPGRPRTVTDGQVEKMITATLDQEPPGGDTHWSTRSMARSEGMSQSTVSRVWRAFGLKNFRRGILVGLVRIIRPGEHLVVNPTGWSYSR